MPTTQSRQPGQFVDLASLGLKEASAESPDTTLQRQAVHMSRPSGVGISVQEFSRACLIRLIDYPEMPLRISTRETIKAGRSALLVKAELPVGSRMVPVAYKRISRHNWLKKLTALPRTNRAARAWQMGHAFLARGVPTPEPLAAIVPRRYEIYRPSYLALEWIDGSLNLHAFCQDAAQFDGRVQLSRLSRAARALARALGRMHAENISHRDLKPSNLLLVDHANKTSAYVIDLDGAEIRSQIPPALRLRNLARLIVGLESCPSVSRSHCLRFLKVYLNVADDSDSNWKTVWRELLTESEHLAARRKRRAKS